MRLPFEVMVALRYMRSGRKAGVSLPTLLTVTGVMVGVAALTVVTSVWNGFEAEFLEKLLGINAHAIVLKRHDVFRNHRETRDKMLEDPRIEHAAPFVYSEVIVQSPLGVQGVAIKGVDPEIAKTTPLGKYVPEGGFDRLTRSKTSTAGRRVLPGILIGKELAESLHAEAGQALTIISPYGGPDGDAQTVDFKIAAVFESGMFEFDSRMVFIDLQEAQDFFRLYKTVTGLEVWTADALTSYDTTMEVTSRLDAEDPRAYEVKDWSRTNQGLFGAVRSQKVLISIVLFIIVVVASFNIMATLILLILTKGREIAILKSLGATKRSILTIFMLDGQIVGFIGCALGTAVGLTLCAVLQQYGLKLDPRVYYLNNLPIVVRPIEVVIVVAGAMLLSMIATVFPAFMAALMKPVDGLTQRRPPLSDVEHGSYRLAGYLMITIVALLFFALVTKAPIVSRGAMAFYLVAYLAARAWLLVDAFKAGTGKGLLLLVLPFYELYFAIMVCRNRTLRGLWAAGAAGLLFVAFLP